MKDLLKEFISQWCKIFGCNEEVQNYAIFGITLFFILVLIFSYLYKFFKYLIKQRNKKILNKNLYYYSNLDVEQCLTNYIRQYFQNISPAIEEEPNPKYASIAREPILKLFLNKIFKGVTKHKYFIILAGAGMGKTSFLINLYLRYLNKPQYLFSIHKYNIEIFPLGLPTVLENIKKVENKKNTILLLDALDEDVEALKDYEARMNTLLNECKAFHKVLITCRTHFFANETEEPYATGDYSFGEQGQYYFKKLYLSYFNERDINKYLFKRFGIFRWYFIPKAKKVISKSTSLFVRPMLLSNIEDLLFKNNPEKITINDIYRTLIDSWLTREGEKYGILELYDSIDNYKEILYSFSKRIAYEIYQNSEENKGYYIGKNSNYSIEIPQNKNGRDLIPNGKKFGIKQLEAEFLNKNNRAIKSKSLFNRDQIGNYKFSHKSILEYFLAMHIIEDHNKAINFDFSAFDLVRQFVLNYYSNERLPALIHRHVLEDRIHDDVTLYVKSNYESHRILFKNEYSTDNFPDLDKPLPKTECLIFIDLNFSFIYRLIFHYNKQNLTIDELKILLRNSYDSSVKLKIFDYIVNSNIHKSISTYHLLGEVDRYRLFSECKIYNEEYFKNFLDYINLVEEIKRSQKQKVIYF